MCALEPGWSRRWVGSLPALSGVYVSLCGCVSLSHRIAADVGPGVSQVTYIPVQSACIPGHGWPRREGNGAALCPDPSPIRLPTIRAGAGQARGTR